MARRLRKNQVKLEFLVVDNGVGHGFLNMQHLTDETHESFQETLSSLQRIIEGFEIDLADSKR